MSKPISSSAAPSLLPSIHHREQRHQDVRKDSEPRTHQVAWREKEPVGVPTRLRPPPSFRHLNHARWRPTQYRRLQRRRSGARRPGLQAGVQARVLALDDVLRFVRGAGPAAQFREYVGLWDGMGYAGTGGMVWGWLISWVFIQCVAMSMAELCSSMPTR